MVNVSEKCTEYEWVDKGEWHYIYKFIICLQMHLKVEEPGFGLQCENEMNITSEMQST